VDPRREIFRLLEEHRAEFVRRSKHEVYQLRNGKIFVTGTTQTDDRGWQNRLAALLGLIGAEPPSKEAARGRKKVAGQEEGKAERRASACVPPIAYEHSVTEKRARTVISKSSFPTT
jgi:hypothetical protein